MSFHENYQLTDADKTAFQALESPDSRAFIIMMTEFAASDVIAYSNNPYGTEAENLLAQAIAQLEILQKTALKPHQLKDLASFVEHRASLWEVKHDAGAAISGLEATDFAQNLQSLARTLRQLDGESGYVGGTISHAPQETPSPTLELEQASYSRLQRFYHPPVSRDRRTPLTFLAKEAAEALREALPDPNRHFAVLLADKIMPKLIDFMKELPTATLLDLHDYANDKAPVPAHCEAVFGHLPSLQEHALKSMVRACITRDPEKGLKVETDVDKALGNLEQQSPSRRMGGLHM